MKFDLAAIAELIKVGGGVIGGLVTAWIINVRKTKVEADKAIELEKIKVDSSDIAELEKQLKIAVDQVSELETDIVTLKQQHAEELAELRQRHLQEMSNIRQKYEIIKNTFGVIFGTLTKILRDSGSEEGVTLVEQLRDLINKQDV